MERNFSLNPMGTAFDIPSTTFGHVLKPKLVRVTAVFNQAS